MTIQEKMLAELETKNILHQARQYAFEYMDDVDSRSVFPTEKSIQALSKFDEVLQEESLSAERVLQQLHQFGSPATIAQTGGRYFGFVNGGIVPVSMGVKWLSDVWDQNGGLYLTSPINAKLEMVCEAWLKTCLRLPKETVAGFVSGTSTANLCGMAAARYHILQKQGWDINENGLNAAPPIRVLAHQETHSSIKKALAILGFGKRNIEWIPSDEQGRIRVDLMPELDATCLVILQAGNVNTGAFDDFDAVCDKANKAGAWVHTDGAFGLWAAASKSLAYLTKGMEKASSWAVDGHKTLNTPYDSGIVLCRDGQALNSALQATGAYITYSDQRDPMLFTPEMSKRSRAIELWATMKYLGQNGIDEMITGFNSRAKQLAMGLQGIGLEVINEVVFNQVLVRCAKEIDTKRVLASVQASGECWMGGTSWNEQAAIRVSICSWRTTKTDIERTIAAFKAALVIG